MSASMSFMTASVDILHPGAHEERQVTSLEPGMFTGEAGMIVGQRAMVRARVRTDSLVHRVLQERPRSSEIRVPDRNTSLAVYKIGLKGICNPLTDKIADYMHFHEHRTSHSFTGR